MSVPPTCPSWVKSAEGLCANQALRNAKMSGTSTPFMRLKSAGQQGAEALHCVFAPRNAPVQQDCASIEQASPRQQAPTLWPHGLQGVHVVPSPLYPPATRQVAEVVIVHPPPAPAQHAPAQGLGEQDEPIPRNAPKQLLVPAAIWHEGPWQHAPAHGPGEQVEPTPKNAAPGGHPMAVERWQWS